MTYRKKLIEVALPLDAILKLTTAELEQRVMPFLKLAAA